MQVRTSELCFLTQCSTQIFSEEIINDCEMNDVRFESGEYDIDICDNTKKRTKHYS